MPTWRRPIQTLQDPYHRRIIARFLLAAGTTIFIHDHVIEPISITGPSMAPTISPHYHETGQEDKLFLRKWNPTHNLQRGDVVQFDNPNKPDKMAVKRVIALEGDTVVLDKRRRPESQMGVDGGRRESPDAMAWDAWKGKAKVPPGHVWVEGDNCGKSKDSNYYGPISKSLIGGKAIVIYWPPARFATKPWEDFTSRTKVIKGGEVKDWTEGLPIELSEIADPHLPR